jgi:hypothetical protein
MSSNERLICGTRAMKNAEHLKNIDPNLSSDTITTAIPMETLRKLHTIDNPLEVIQNKEIASLVSKNKPPIPEDRSSGPLFNGTLRFVKFTFKNIGRSGTLSISDTDMQTIIDYASRAIKPLSQYISQYGSSLIDISKQIINFDADLGGRNTFNRDILDGWIDQIAQTNNLRDDSCVMVLTPPGVENISGTGRILGYHWISTRNGIPYCYCRVRGSNLTLDDKQNVYAETLTHEVAEMAVDPNPRQRIRNPEVCDACAGNCNNNWVAYFDNNNKFLGASQDSPDRGNPFPGYAYFTATVVGTNFQLGGSESCLVRDEDKQIACAYDPASPPSSSAH